jgi:uncharacterized protein (TIGR00251 family)
VGKPKGEDFRTTALPVWMDRRPEGVVLALHLQPGARRTAVVGPHGARLKIAVASPPADGRANAALLEFLAERLAVPKGALTLLSGASSREKRVAVATPLPPASIADSLLPAQRK